MSAGRVSLCVVLAAAGVAAVVVVWLLAQPDSAALNDPKVDLKDPRPAVRFAAIRSLGKPGPDRERRAEALVEALDSPHADIRLEAARVLCWIGPASGPALIRALTDPRPRVRAGAALALGDLLHKDERHRAPGEVEAIVPLLRDLLKDKDPEIRRNAARTLGTVGSWDVEETIRHLGAALRDEETPVRAAAIQSLAAISWGKSGLAAPDVVSDLRKALNDPNVRGDALKALCRFDPHSRETITAAVRALGDEDTNVRYDAGLHLHHMDPEPGIVVPALVTVLGDRRADVRAAAANALWRLRRKAREAVPALSKALTDQDEAVRYQAAGALGEIGPDAKDAVGALTEALQDTDRSVRFRAAVALWKIDRRGKVVLPIFIEALRDKEWQRREAAAQALGEMGAEAREAVPALREARKDDAPGVHSAAEDALQKIVPGEMDIHLGAARPESVAWAGWLIWGSVAVALVVAVVILLLVRHLRRQVRQAK
jgi:HEAT repeat protein